MVTIPEFDLSSSTGPKYLVLSEAIRGAIGNGRLSPGDRLPPVRELAYQLGVTPGTVARAYQRLTDAGALSAQVGRGTFVAAGEPGRNRRLDDDNWKRQTEAPEAEGVNLFSPRLPDVGQVAAIRDAFARIGQTDPMRLLNYPMRHAYRPLREAVVHWLRDVPLGPLSDEDVVLTHGGQSAICTVLQAVLAGPRPVILVEDLSYAGFRRAAEILRAEAVGVPLDGEGVVPGELEAIAHRTGAQVFCTSPEVQNPTALHTPLARRKALAEVARRTGMQILDDDCYRMGPAAAPSYRMLAPERGWHVSSLSKTLTPALRVGFAIAPQGRGGDLRRVAEYGFFGIAQPLAEVMELLLKDHRTETLIEAVRHEIAAYIRIAVNVLGRYDLVWHEDVPFVWLHLPSGWRAAAFCRAAAAEGVQIRSADEFALRDGRAPHAVRVAVNAQVSIGSFEAALMRLKRLLDNPPEQIAV